MATNFEPNEFIIFVQSMEICTHENKAIHSTYLKRCQKYEEISHHWLIVDCDIKQNY